MAAALKTIHTPRLTLVCCTKEIIEAVFKGDEALATFLQINIDGNWTEFGEQAFRWTYNKLCQPNASPVWWTYLPVLKEGNKLAGSCGYKSEPANGMVEIGYEVAAMHRGQGLATEIATALIKQAFAHDEVSKVQAHTLAEENESGAVLTKCGMKKVEELQDPEDGKVWRWEIIKQ